MSHRTTLLRLAAALGCLVLMSACISEEPAHAQDQDSPEPWNWSEEFVREAVGQVRAGRDLNPSSWPDGARVAVLLSPTMSTTRRCRASVPAR